MAAYDLVIVGMGSAGMVAAEFAASLGIRTCAVERDRIGGDCLWTGCVPSKALLASAKVAHHMRTASDHGITAVEPEIDTAAVLARVRRIQQDIAATDDDPGRYAEMGVDLRLGEPARLESSRHVRVGAEVIEARHVLLCTGSRPAEPDIDGLAAAGYLTSETLWEAERAPASMIAVGGGPIAIELAQAFTRLGVPVDVLQRGDRILPRDEPELVDRLAGRLRAEGVRLHLGADVQRVTVQDGRKVVHGTLAGETRTWSAEEILVGVGRRPNVEGLGLEAAGIETGPRGVIVDERSRTTADGVYAVGDLAGRHLFTHSAASEAAKAVRDMFFPGRGRFDNLVPWCTFTDPELAHAGCTSAEAIAEHGEDDVEIHRKDLASSDRARAEGAEDGIIVAVTHKRRLIGAHVLAPGAGEVIQELSLAIERRMRFAELSSLIHVYPTIATSVAQLAAEAAYEGAQRYRWLIRT